MTVCIVNVKLENLILDKTGVVDMYERCHEELAIKPVHDTPMAWYCVSKILKYE